ncbi:MAG: hypothetical protein ABIH53_00365 [archaeon]
MNLGLINKLAIKLHFGDLAKLFKAGRIGKVYENMYRVAESLGIHETLKMQDIIYEKHLKSNSENKELKYSKEIMDYRGQRIQHHLDEMKKLLLLQVKMQNEPTTKKKRV